MYLKLLQIALKGLLQFRADFIIGVVGVITQNSANLLAIGVILGRFTDLANWTIWQIVFLYGLWMTGNSIYSLLFFHIIDLENYIVDGSFDRFLIRPISPLLQLLTVDLNFNGVSDIIFGVSALALAMSHLGLWFDLPRWLYLGVMLVSAALLELGLTLALASVAFWSGRSSSLIYIANTVNWRMTQQYPLEVFSRGFRVLVTTLIPVAFINYYPARYLLGKIGPGDPWYFLSFLSPVAAMVFLGIAGFVWNRGIRAYSGTGS